MAQLSLEKNLALFAGAGAGKTHGLITLCLHLLGGAREGREPLPPQRLCLVTFTEKAAGEMRQRLRQRVEGLVRGEPEPELAASFERLGRPAPPSSFWRGVLAGLGAASVSTFHSFCLALLKRTPGGIEPGTVLLDEREAREIVAACAEREVLEALERGEPEVEALCRELEFGGGGREGLVSSLATVLGAIREEGLCATGVGHGTEADARSEFDARLAEIRGALAEAIQLDAKQQFREAHLDVAAALEGTRFATFFVGGRRAGLEAAVRGIDARKGGAELKRVNATVRRGVLGHEKEHVLSLAELRAACDAVHHERAFLALLGRVEARHRRELERRAAVDFTELLVRSRNLLRDDPEARTAAQARIGALLVDEFQDTNRLQLELVLLLAERREGGPRPLGEDGVEALPLEPASLCAVGDRKQAIYGFRGADVSLFERLANKIVAEGGERQALQRSWRSRPRLVAAFNWLFAQVLVPPASPRPYEVGYAPALDDLAAVRTEEGGPPIQVLARAEGEDAEADRRLDAEAVARAIAALIAGGETLTVRKERRPLRGGDVAILLRSFTRVEVYQRALLARGIPHRVVRGRGFYGAQEVLDLASLFALLADSNDGVAAAAVLRSPLVAISDPSLAALGLTFPGLPFDRLAREARPGLPAAEEDRLARFLDGYRRWRGGRGQIGLGPLLDEVLEVTGFLAALAASPLGEQAIANVQKLRARAAEWDRERPADLEGFARELRALVDRDPTEAQADAFDPGDPRAVQLLTVHQAKGLEWPVVVLPALGARGKNDSDRVLFERAQGLAVRPRVPDAAKLGHSGRSRRIADERKRRGEAESLRLLYVALTRARDRVLLSGVAGGGKGTWAGALAPWLDSAPEEWVEKVAVESLPRPNLAEAHGDSVPDAEGQVRRAILQARTPPAVRSGRVALPVTQLQDFALCPRRFHLLHELGVVESPRVIELDALEPPGEAGGLGDPRRKGKLAHRLLERIDFRAAVSAGGRGQLEALLRAEGLDAAGEDVREVVGWVEALIASPLAQRLAAAVPGRLKRELPFVLRVGQRPPFLFLKGQIDLLLEDERGAVVLDYKAARRHPKGAQAYRFQLACYALAARRWLGEQASIRTGLVYLRERPLLADEEEVSPPELARIEGELEALASDLARATAAGAWSGRALGDCQALRCGFVSRCHPAGRAL